MSLYVGVDKQTAQPICTTLSEEQILRVIERYYQPNFGDVKYVVRPSVEIIDEDSEQFDGWVYADGSVRNKADYPAAQRYYKTSDGTFQVENLYTFIQCDGQADQTTHLESQIETVSEHQHHYDVTAKYKADIVLTAAFNIAVTDTIYNYLIHPNTGNTYKVDPNTYNINTINAKVDSGYIPTAHGVYNQDATGKLISSPLMLNMNSNFKVIDTGPAGDEHPDCYPAHVKVFPFVYIGKKTQTGV